MQMFAWGKKWREGEVGRSVQKTSNSKITTDPLESGLSSLRKMSAEKGRKRRQFSLS